jgi:hypothetical protein
MVHPDCAYLIRTLPSLVSDDTKPEDVDSDGEDHSADALRYFVMSRPTPGSISKKPVPPPMSMAWLRARATIPQGILSRRSA